ncbi:beta-1,3-galactosyltransferase 2-like [Pseudophryne corroboree]|uniref:beta-1,3-galactosyltransferase 2-like n=1 Tax=Pseudophryne corroboree TaxID=495146 RepID=UPI0030820A05
MLLLSIVIMISQRKHHCCTLRLKLTTKRLMFYGIVSGFFTFAFLVFMLLTVNNYEWFPRRSVVTENLQARNSFQVSSRTSQTSPMLLENLVKSQDFHHYRYIINEPNKCQKKSPFLILLIAIQTWQQEARHAIRQTWGKEDLLPGVHTLRLFLLGKDTDLTNETKQTLLNESQQYNDIIQQDFMDTYNNLTLKTLMGLDWIATYCPQVPYVMKIDSDMFVNTEYLITNLLKPDQPPRIKYFTGYLMRDYIPNRNAESKWYMPPELYPGDRYPVFCSGTGYVFSGDLAEEIINISGSIKMLHLEDVYVGICLDKLGIVPVPPPKESDFNHWKVSYSPCTYSKLVTSHQYKPSELLWYWDNLQQNKHKCFK